MDEQKLDSELEDILLKVIGMPEDKAAKAAHIQNMDYFEKKFKRLECLVGDNTAYDIAEKGEFALYKNGELDRYFSLATKVVELTKEHIYSEDFKKNAAKFFYSIESLETFLKEESEQEESKKIAGVSNGEYRLLSRTDQQAIDYLAEIIDEGKLTVRGHEHWAKKGLPTGLRGQNILKHIAWEIKRMCREAGMQDPYAVVMHGQKSIEVDDATRTTLRIIRDKVYN
jgi:hypothetical protein